MAITWSDGSSSMGMDEPVAATEPLVVTNGVPAGFLFHPTFRTGGGVTRGGIVFAARGGASSDPVLISALRLMGPAGGLDRPIDALDLFTSVQSVDLRDCQSGRFQASVPGKTLIIPGAKAFPASSLHGDVIAFRPDAMPDLTPLQLSDSQTWPGEKAWIPSSKDPSSTAFHAAKILTNRNGRMVLEIEERCESLSSIEGFFGAPVINSANEIVGVVSVVQTKDDRCRLLATPSVRFIDYL